MAYEINSKFAAYTVKVPARKGVFRYPDLAPELQITVLAKYFEDTTLYLTHTIKRLASLGSGDRITRDVVVIQSKVFSRLSIVNLLLVSSSFQRKALEALAKTVQGNYRLIDTTDWWISDGPAAKVTFSDPRPSNFGISAALNLTIKTICIQGRLWNIIPYHALFRNIRYMSIASLDIKASRPELKRIAPDLTDLVSGIRDDQIVQHSVQGLESAFSKAPPESRLRCFTDQGITMRWNLSYSLRDWCQPGCEGCPLTSRELWIEFSLNSEGGSILEKFVWNAIPPYKRYLGITSELESLALLQESQRSGNSSRIQELTSQWVS